jgi:hypothetical protein
MNLTTKDTIMSHPGRRDYELDITAGDCYNEGDEVQEVTMIDPDSFLPLRRRFKKLKEGEL